MFEQLMLELRDRGWTQAKLKERLALLQIEVGQSTLSDLATGRNENPNWKLGDALRTLHQSGEQADDTVASD